MNETEVTHVLTSERYLTKLMALKKNIAKLSTIIFLDTNIDRNEEEFHRINSDHCFKLLALSELEKMVYQAKNDQALPYLSPKEEDIAIILYTSGN